MAHGVTKGRPTTVHLDVGAELRRLPLFRALDTPLLVSLGRAAQVVTLPRGAPLYHQGDPPHHLFVLVGGRVKVTREDAAGRELIVDLQAAPVLLGEFAAYTGRPHVMTAVALESCTVVLIPREVLRRTVDASAPLAAHFLALFQERYERLSARLEDLAGAPVERRLARLLLRLRPSERSGGQGERVIPLALNRAELACLIATTTETVVRLLTRWRSLGVIGTPAEGIVVKRWETLERLACGAAETLAEVWAPAALRRVRAAGELRARDQT
jgi:CRP-like cAMP-binding protein